MIENKKLSEIELNEAMENLIEQYKGNNEIGIVYKNFATGYRYAQEDNHYFTAASTVKVIYAMKIYDRIRNGEISKNADIAYNEKFLEEGNGQITNSPKKDSYKLEYVIQNMIQYSDNTATNMLVGNSATAADLVVKYVSSLGARLPQEEAQNNKITPAMMELVWTKLYKGAVPVNAGLLLLVIAFLMMLTGSFDMLTDLLVFVMWFFYTATFLAVIILRKKEPNLERPYRVPLYPIVPIIAILGGVYTLVSTLISQTSLAMGGIALTLIGLLFYTELHKKFKK